MIVPGNASEPTAKEMAFRAWLVVAATFVACAVGWIQLFKVPPVMLSLIEAFGLSRTQASLLISAFALGGVLVAIPGVLLIRRFGHFAAGAAALGCLVLGSYGGAATSSFELLLVSRLVEGAGAAVSMMAAPAVIALWFPEARRGLPLGIWATNVPIAILVSFNLAPVLASRGWQFIWRVSAGVALVALLAYVASVRVPPRPSVAEARAPNTTQLAQRRDIWLLAGAFFCFNAALAAWGSFFPTFLVEVRDYSLTRAGFLSSLDTFVLLGSATLAGWISDRIASRRAVVAYPLLAMASVMPLFLLVEGAPLYGLAIVLGLLEGGVPAGTFAAIPEVVADQRSLGVGTAIISVGQNLGMATGPVMFGLLIDACGWSWSATFFIPVCLAGFIAARMLRVR